MEKLSKEEQNLINSFDVRNSIPSKKFEKNLDKAMQEVLLTKKSGFLASFSFYMASLAVIVFTGVLSAAFIHVFTNTSQQTGNIRILSDSEKTLVMQNINKNNINFLKQPEKIEKTIETEENTKINKTSVAFTSTAYTPVCTNLPQILEYNIYTYTEAGSVYVKEELKTTQDIYEKITKDLNAPVYYKNSELSFGIEAPEIFANEYIYYDLDDSSLAFDTSSNRYVYKLRGEVDCGAIAAPISFVQTDVNFANSTISFERDIYVNEDDFKITKEVIRAEDSTQVYYYKDVATSQIDATVTVLTALFRITH